MLFWELTEIYGNMQQILVPSVLLFPHQTRCLPMSLQLMNIQKPVFYLDVKCVILLLRQLSFEHPYLNQKNSLSVSSLSFVSNKKMRLTVLLGSLSHLDAVICRYHV